MKRYKMAGSFGPDAYTTKMWSLEEDPDGEWVRYEDVEGMVEGVTLECESVECNCEEQSEEHIGKSNFMFFWEYHAWICPAHGYKRL